MFKAAFRKCRTCGKAASGDGRLDHGDRTMPRSHGGHSQRSGFRALSASSESLGFVAAQSQNAFVTADNNKYPTSSFRRTPESRVLEHELGPGLRRDDGGVAGSRVTRARTTVSPRAARPSGKPVSGQSTAHSAISARFPTSSVPRSASRPSARAPSRVIPASDSAGVRPNSVQAMFIARRGDSSGEVPGLQSVATAIGMPAARRAATGVGGFRAGCRRHRAEGRRWFRWRPWRRRLRARGIRRGRRTARDSWRPAPRRLDRCVVRRAA